MFILLVSFSMNLIEKVALKDLWAGYKLLLNKNKIGELFFSTQAVRDNRSKPYPTALTAVDTKRSPSSFDSY